MIHQLIFASPKPGLTESQFLDYWIHVHAIRYARRIPQIRKYLIASRLPFSSETAPRLCTGVAEIWLTNAEEQLASLATPEFLEGARQDEPRWAAFWQTLVLDTDEHLLLESVPPLPKRGLVKVFQLIKRRPGSALDEFRQRCLAELAPLQQRLPGVRRVMQCHTRNGAYAIGEAPLDAAMMIWFDDTAAAEAALRSAAGEQYLVAVHRLADPRYVHAFLADETWIIGPSPRPPTLDRELITATRRRDAVTAKQLLDQGASPEARDENGMTALMVASGQGDVNLVDLLLRAGANPNAVEPGAGAGALHKACQYGDLTVAQRLLAAGALIDAQAATTGHTPLLEAIWYKRVEIARELISRGAGLHVPTHYGFSLQDHITYGLKANARGIERLQVIQALVAEREAHDTAQEQSQALMAATARGDADAVRSLLAQGAAVDELFPIRNGFNDSHTPLLVAARDGHLEIVRLLLAAGADVNATEPTFGAVPLHKAVYNGRVDIARLLTLQPGIDLDRQGPTNGYTPLHDAIWHGYEDCAELLIAAAARLDLQGHDGKTPLDLAREVFGPNHRLVERLAAASAAAK